MEVGYTITTHEQQQQRQATLTSTSALLLLLFPGGGVSTGHGTGRRHLLPVNVLYRAMQNCAKLQATPSTGGPHEDLSDAALTRARHWRPRHYEVRSLSQGALLPEGGRRGHPTATTTPAALHLCDAQTQCCPKQLSRVASHSSL